jgi:hypothetical protein
MVVRSTALLTTTAAVVVVVIIVIFFDPCREAATNLLMLWTRIATLKSKHQIIFNGKLTMMKAHIMQ